MAKLNILFRKGYLLAGVMMAANMFVVNEVKAMENDDTGNNFPPPQTSSNSGSGLNNSINNIEEYERINKTESENLDVTDEDQYAPSFLDRLLYKLLFRENIINFFGGLVFSGANNYFKLWDYNPGGYWKIGCLGWRSGRLIKDIFQFDINLNLGRGVLWTTFFWLNYPTMPKIMIIARLIVEFISIPLAIHIHGFDISIALDSILFGLVVTRYNLSYLLSSLIVKDNYEIKDDNSIDKKSSPGIIDYYYPYQQNNDNINNSTTTEKLDDNSPQLYMNNSTFSN